jgi:hypothetical protein
MTPQRARLASHTTSAAVALRPLASLTPQTQPWRHVAWHVVLVALAGWLNREQQKIVEYLREENRVLREQLGSKRLRFTARYGSNSRFRCEGRRADRTRTAYVR